MILVLLLLGSVGGARADTTALDFWNSYDARGEPLDVEVVKRWEDEIGRYQLVRYRLGTLAGSNKTASPIIAAYYGAPKEASNTEKVPGIVHIHGGGQRAHQRRVRDWVKLRFACISINRGGKVLEAADTPNTDRGHGASSEPSFHE